MVTKEANSMTQLQHTLVFLARRTLFMLGMFALLSLFGLLAFPLSRASAAVPAYVRIIQASPYVGTADIFVDGARVLGGMQFAAVTSYVQLPAGPHKVQIALIGKGVGAAALTQTLSVQAGVAYTVAAIGTSPTNLSMDVFQDNNLVSSGLAKVRMYHLAPSIGTVNVTSGSNTFVSGLAYAQASNYFILPAGAYTFTITASQPNLSLPVSANLQMNTVTSVFAVGMLNSTPKLRFVTSQVNALPDVPSTGSDPNPQLQPGNADSSFPSLSPWLLAVVAFVAIASGIGIYRLAASHQKNRVH